MDYEVAKSRGQKKTNPDNSKEWRQMWNADEKKKACRVRRHCRVKVRRDLAKLAQDDEHKTPKADSVTWNRHMPYYREFLFPWKTLRHWQLLRTNVFCKKCGFKLCDHRKYFGAAMFILLWKRKFLADFPKDIILLMSRMIFEAHLDFLRINYLKIEHISDYYIYH